jgi:hypothetical protein
VQPLQPNVPLRQQIPTTTAAKALPVSQSKIESSVISNYRYDPDAEELHVVTKGNPSTTYVYGDVSQTQADAFENASSKGKAWAQFKQQSSPLIAKIVNGKRVPVRPVIKSEF